MNSPCIPVSRIVVLPARNTVTVAKPHELVVGRAVNTLFGLPARRALPTSIVIHPTTADYDNALVVQMVVQKPNLGTAFQRGDGFPLSEQRVAAIETAGGYPLAGLVIRQTLEKCEVSLFRRGRAFLYHESLVEGVHRPNPTLFNFAGSPWRPIQPIRQMA